jgi:hypothetical protein
MVGPHKARHTRGQGTAHCKSSKQQSVCASDASTPTDADEIAHKLTMGSQDDRISPTTVQVRALRNFSSIVRWQTSLPINVHACMHDE